MPVLSIIIPTFNSAKTLANALDSVLSQTFHDFEILVVDGLSTDDTPGMLKRYSETDERIRFVSEKDNGIYDAMNKGIGLAKGDWIYFLGSDDRLYGKNVLAAVFERIPLQAADVLYGDVHSTLFGGIYDGAFTEEKLLDRNICHQAIFYKNEVFRTIGKYNCKYKGMADWDHNFRWFLSDSIRNSYIDVVIADFAEGGFSNASEDPVFKRERVLNFLRYGRKRIPMGKKWRLLKSLLGYALMRKDGGLIGRIIFYFPSIIAG